MMKAIDLLQQFEYQRKGHGWKIQYRTKKRGDYWIAHLDGNMGNLMERIFNSEHTSLSDVKWLRYLVMKDGTHYSLMGKIIKR